VRVRRPQLKRVNRERVREEALRRGKRGLLIAVPAFLVIALVSGLSLSLLFVFLVLLGLYVTPWDELPLGRVALPLAAVLLALAYPYYVGGLFEVPIFKEFPSVDTAVTMVIFIMMAIGLNIVVGYAGLLDLGYVAFYAMGAYTAAWFASPHFGESVQTHIGSVGVSPEARGFHVSVWLILILAAIFTAVIGVIIGLPTLRLRGDYLFNTGFNLTNGAQGINPIDPPGFGSTLSGWLGLPDDYLTFSEDFLGKTITSVELYYWTGVLLLLFTIFCSIRLRESRLGRAWIAIREDETAAAAMGVPLMRTKTWAYAAGAFFGGIAGAYYASFKAGTFPDDFFFNISVFILCMVILGGMGTIWGVIIGGAFLSYLNQEGLANIGAWMNQRFATDDADWVTVFDSRIDVPLYTSGIFGVILVLVMLFKPEGLIPSARRKAEFREKLHDEPLMDVRK
jgi:branched-chain amino acid transport system permease protein